MDAGVHGESSSDDTGLLEVADRYETWRRRWVSVTGKEPSRDAPELSDGRLWFRDGYPHPDWTARIIESSNVGYLVLSVTTERRNTPRAAVEAVFSHLEDAGKYVIAFIGDMLRLEYKLEPLYRQWRTFGVDSALEKGAADDEIVQFIADYNDVSRDTVQRLVYKYSVKAQPARYAHLATADEPTSRVLTLSYDELDAILIDGLGATT